MSLPFKKDFKATACLFLFTSMNYSDKVCYNDEIAIIGL